MIRLAASGKTLTIRTDEDGVSINDPAATQAEWRRLHPIAAVEESLYEVAEATVVDERDGEFSLEDEAALERWLSAWHTASCRSARRACRCNVSPERRSHEPTTDCDCVSGGARHVCGVLWPPSARVARHRRRSRRASPGRSAGQRTRDTQDQVD